ncbi:hypothetical protein [Umezawaea tangerina]|uniref:Uncharacterized protein n=1 Tax=Umezawaea tangerina TaxID=84725 RepID=A0A2T0T4V0_9PSEU|nr:hypothetical protein [Umezawaea tangerina]PRY40663.1 hypothetical protein CLV43_106404 [Umezawaea tangerina]
MRRTGSTDGAGALRCRAVAELAGEDLRSGEVTMPLAPERTARVWEAGRGGADDLTVREVAAELVACDAVQAFRDETLSHVDSAWTALEPLPPNTFAKVVCRALGR